MRRSSHRRGPASRCQYSSPWGQRAVMAKEISGNQQSGTKADLLRRLAKRSERPSRPDAGASSRDSALQLPRYQPESSLRSSPHHPPARANQTESRTRDRAPEINALRNPSSSASRRRSPKQPCLFPAIPTTATKLAIRAASATTPRVCRTIVSVRSIPTPTTRCSRRLDRRPSDFNLIPLGGTVPLVDPQAGLAFDSESTDSHQLAIPVPPPLSSAKMADNAVENYWQALLRDVPFSEYDTDPDGRGRQSRS